MKKLRLHLLILLLSYTSMAVVARQSEGYSIKGKVTNEFEGYLYLITDKSIDSVKVVDHKFAFSGIVEYPVEATIRTKNGATTSSIYLGNTQSQVELSVRDNNTYVGLITGNPTQVILEDLMAFYGANEDEDYFSDRFYKKLESIISTNPRSQFNGELLSDVIMDPIFSFEESMSLFTKMDTTTQTRESIRSIKKSLYKLKNTRIGTTLPGFSFPDQYDESINLSDFNGKLVLVEFWSSSCGPCRKTNPQLAEIYKDFGANGFHIFSISLDHDKTTWLKAMEKDGINWTSTMAKGGFRDPAIELLKVQYLPSNYLLDKKGKILAINIKPEELTKKLTELLE